MRRLLRLLKAAPTPCSIARWHTRHRLRSIATGVGRVAHGAHHDTQSHDLNYKHLNALISTLSIISMEWNQPSEDSSESPPAIAPTRDDSAGQYEMKATA